MSPNDSNVVDTTDKLSLTDLEKSFGEDDDKIVIPPDDELDPEPEPDPEEKVTGKEDEELAAELAELEEPSVDEDELEFVAAPRRQEILKEYPELFKKFPYLERAFYKVTKYDEMFSDLKSAQLSAQKADALDRFGNDLMTGNIESIFSEVKKLDGNAFNKIVDNLLPALNKIEPNVVKHIQRDIIGRLVLGMEAQAKDDSNETVAQAAEVVKQLIFGNGKIEAKKLATEDNKVNTEAQRLQMERQQFAQQKFEQTAGEVANKIQTSLKSIIESNIDPKNSMSEYVKKHASAEALGDLEFMMRNDRSFAVAIQKCWNYIWANNYSPDSVEKLMRVYKAKAKTVLPQSIQKARRSALKDAKSTTRESKSEAKTSFRTTGEKAEPKKAAPVNDKGKKMSTLDFLMKD